MEVFVKDIIALQNETLEEMTENVNAVKNAHTQVRQLAGGDV